MKSVRLYGLTEDNGSFSQVTRGFRDAFLAHGYTKETLDVVSLESEAMFDDEPSGLPSADVGILIGPPTAAKQLTQGANHKERLVYVMPNSSKLPERTMHTVNSFATKILAPSAWAETVIKNYTELPIQTVPLGISDKFQPVKPDVDLELHLIDGDFRILHLSSSDGERKGTPELVRAFLSMLKEKALPKNSQLLLVLTPRGLGQVTDLLGDLRSEGAAPGHIRQIKLMGRLGPRGADPTDMAKIYSSAHVVCQPSRGEGFGMVPLEALASGAPVVATKCTGHSEWWNRYYPGLVPVETGELSPIDDMPGAMAPSLAPADIRASLIVTYEHWRELKAAALDGAEVVRDQWAWQNRLREFIASL